MSTQKPVQNAFLNAIKTVGIANFKRTSLFATNEINVETKNIADAA